MKIPLQEILSVTNRFSEANLIVRGGFGHVYQGHSKQHGILAIKRLENRLHGQGDREFGMEIALLSVYKHENIVSLVGFCDEGGEKILVYKFEINGSLDKHLHKKDLTWERRLQICIDAARGLRYLHDEVGPGQRVIHRDIKSGNILLDKNLKAKISDFGLSKIGLANVPFSVQFSNACGTPGYVAPEFLNSVLTQKADVYSFGVVLFEVLFGKLVTVDQPSNRVDARRFTVVMAQNHYANNTLDKIIDPVLRNQMTSTSLRTFSTVAYQSLKSNRDERPTMRLVVEELEKALGHQHIIERKKAFSGFSHDVYISFNNQDFSDYECEELSKDLIQNDGLSVYKKNLKRSLLKESEVMQAIEQSRACIIVFSHTFAGNSLCLDEVVKMMECRRERNQIILPIFYFMDSSDVLTQSGYFGETFFKFNGNSKIGVWKNALVEAASQLPGIHHTGFG